MKVHIRSMYINEEGTVGRGSYADGSLALLFAPSTGEPAFALSTNLFGHGLTPAADHVYVKGYGEHTGLCAALVDTKVVELAGEIIFGPYDTPAYLVKVLI